MAAVIETTYGTFRHDAAPPLVPSRGPEQLSACLRNLPTDLAISATRLWYLSAVSIALSCCIRTIASRALASPPLNVSPEWPSDSIDRGNGLDQS